MIPNPKAPTSSSQTCRNAPVAARRGNPQLAVLAERHAVLIVRLGVEGFQLQEVLGADGQAVDGRGVDDGFATVGMAGKW